MRALKNGEDNKRALLAESGLHTQRRRAVAQAPSHRELKAKTADLVMLFEGDTLKPLEAERALLEDRRCVT